MERSESSQRRMRANLEGRPPCRPVRDRDHVRTGQSPSLQGNARSQAFISICKDLLKHNTRAPRFPAWRRGRVRYASPRMKPVWAIATSAAAVMALMTRLWFVGVFADSPLYEPLPGAHDRTIYHEAGQAVAGGEIWPDGSFEYMPLYPWVLGAGYRVFGDRLAVPTVLGIVCEVLTVLLMVLLARQWGAHPLTALLAAGLYALYPLAIAYAPLTMPNTLNVFLVTALVFVLNNTRLQGIGRSAGAGLFAGVTALGFAGALMIAAVFAVWRVVEGVRSESVPWKGAALFVMAFALPLVPVAVHNTKAEGAFVLLTTHGGFNFYMGNHERATGYPVRVRDFRMTARAMLEDAHRAAEQEVGRSLSRAESAAWWTEQGRAFWREHPGQALSLTVKKAALFWNHRDVDDLRQLEQLRLIDRVFVSAVWPGFAFFGLLGWIGLCYARRATVPRLVLVAGMISVVLFFITARYRLTFVPLMGALGAAGLPVLWSLMRARSLRLLWLLPGMALIAWPFEVRDLRPVDHYNASVQVLADGDAQRALHLAREGLLIDPRNADLYHAKGSALATLERYEAAAAAFQQCVALNPVHASGRYNLALSLARLERVCEAADVLEEWVEIAPHDTRSVRLHADLRRLCEDGAGR